MRIDFAAGRLILPQADWFLPQAELLFAAGHGYGETPCPPPFEFPQDNWFLHGEKAKDNIYIIILYKLLGGLNHFSCTENSQCNCRLLIL